MADSEQAMNVEGREEWREGGEEGGRERRGGKEGKRISQLESRHADTDETNLK